MAKGIYERKWQQGNITYNLLCEYEGIDIKERVGRKSSGFTREMERKALRSRLGEIAQGQIYFENLIITDHDLAN